MGVSHLVLLLGLTITAIVALLQQSNLKNTRQLTFDAAAAHAQEELADAVTTRVEQFTSGLNFISATHPGPLEEYRSYFSNRSSARGDADPGYSLVEQIPADDIAALVRRETALGNDGFAPFVLPSDRPDRFIVTRTAHDTRLLGLPVVGMDISPLYDDLSLETLTEPGLVMFVVRNDQVSNMLGGGLEPGGYTAFVAADVLDPEGQLVGYAIELQQIEELLSSISEAELEGLSVELYVDEFDEPIDDRLSPQAPDRETAELQASRVVTIASLTWRVEVWADDDFGPSTGLFDQTWVWIIGIMITVGAYAASVRRQKNRLRLDRARFELAHARTLAMTDGLTGLLNRNGLVEAARQYRSDSPATVFFIDLDGFKAVNDTGGHELGDQVLRSVAGRLGTIFRADDLVSRLGGDEFVVFTGGESTEEYMASISRRITESISEVDERVTCSLGVASRATGQRIDIKDLLRAADAAMYEAKRSGGDRFTVSGAEVS